MSILILRWRREPAERRDAIFDSSVAMAEAAARGVGVGLVPIVMFQNELASGRLARPFAAEVPAGSYWLSWLKSKDLTPGMRAFRDWLLETLRVDASEEDAREAPVRQPKQRAKRKIKRKVKAAKKRWH